MDRLTIDELARAAGTKVSTIRLYQQRGLLPPPAIEGRVGFYDETHLARLRLVADLQTRGFSLAAILAIVDVDRPGLEGLFTTAGREHTLTELTELSGALAAFAVALQSIRVSASQGRRESSS